MLRNNIKCHTFFSFRWSVTIIFKSLVHYIISKMLVNPEYFQPHLKQAGVEDPEGTVRVSQCTIHHSKSESVRKIFLSYRFSQWGNATRPPVKAIRLLQETVLLGASHELVCTRFQTVCNYHVWQEQTCIKGRLFSTFGNTSMNISYH